jgi:hypothetical protein
MTRKELEVFCKGAAPVIRAYVTAQIAALEVRIKELEQQVRDTENKSVSFRGVWQEGKAYGRGSAAKRLTVDRTRTHMHTSGRSRRRGQGLDVGRQASPRVTVERLTPASAAALLLAFLEAHAIVSLSEGDFVRVDLNPITDFGSTLPETLAHAVLGLRDELRQILIARRTVH